MSRSEKKKNRLSPRKWFSEPSLRWAMTTFILAILLNAALMTSSSYMLLRRTKLLEPVTNSHLYPLFLMLLCIAIAALLTGIFLDDRIKPIHRVNEAMKKVSRGDFSERVDDKKCSGEIRELVQSYNHMAEELSGIEMFRTDFINNFSHEFKTPIVSIRGFARQLERDDITDEQRREYTRIIVSESERLANMSSNVLLLTKLENQQIITDKKPYMLDEQLRNCILLMEKQWSDKNLELRLELDEVEYNGDEEMMSHVWLNLISNAIKYSPEGGLLELGCMRVQNFIVVHVTDHGEGMDEMTQLRIFEKFYQGDSAHAAEGNGLGLSLVKRIAELCGGKVAVNSAPGEGSMFSVYLPVGEQD